MRLLIALILLIGFVGFICSICFADYCIVLKPDGTPLKCYKITDEYPARTLSGYYNYTVPDSVGETVAFALSEANTKVVSLDFKKLCDDNGTSEVAEKTLQERLSALEGKVDTLEKAP